MRLDELVMKIIGSKMDGFAKEYNHDTWKSDPAGFGEIVRFSRQNFGAGRANSCN